MPESMTKPSSIELRELAVRFVNAGKSRDWFAARLGVSPSREIKWLDRYHMTGSVKSGRMGGNAPRKISGEHRDWVLAQISAGDVTHQGLADGLADRGLMVDYRTMWNFVHSQGKRLK
jgi:putative transposase